VKLLVNIDEEMLILSHIRIIC